MSQMFEEQSEKKPWKNKKNYWAGLKIYCLSNITRKQMSKENEESL